MHHSYLLIVTLVFLYINSSTCYDDDVIHKHKSYLHNGLADDITTECRQNITTDIFLSSASGVSDARVLTIAIPNYDIHGCPIDVTLSPYKAKGFSYALIFVVEFINNDAFNVTCGNKNSKMLIFIGNQSKAVFDICEEYVNFEQTYYVQRDEKYIRVVTFFDEPKKAKKYLSLSFNVVNFSGTIKLTITSAKKTSDHDDCAETKDLFCKVREKLFCVNQFLKCDGNANCGHYTKYDESKIECEDSSSSTFWKVALQAIVILFVVCFILSQLLRVCVPSVAKDFFIFDEDEENKLVLISQSLPPPDSGSESHASSTKESERDLAIINKINTRSANYLSLPNSETAIHDQEKQEKKKRFIRFLDI